MNSLSINGNVPHMQEQQLQQQQIEARSPVAEPQQIINLNNIGDLTQEISDDTVGTPKEIILITVVKQEPALFNPKHEHYRSTQHKDAKWMEIAEHVGWPEAQCKAKWKALRDQYCRELKRAKLNTNTNVKWKYFKELDFLRPYALARHYRSRNGNNLTLTSTVNAPMIGNASYNANTITKPAALNANIKIETGLLNCSFANALTTTSTPNDSGSRLIPALTAEQINNVIQQQDGNWNYLTTTNSLPASTMNSSRSDSQQGQTIAEDALLNALVDCVAAAATSSNQISQQQQHQHQQHQNQQQLQQQNAEEEDDDPIHTFLNMESYFEKELIALIQQEDILYNNYNHNYRNVKLKLEVWDDIAHKLKKSVKQCRQKWKALRDQYIREHKRLKNRENAEETSRWKHYDSLSFLHKFIKQKSSGNETHSQLHMPKTENDVDMEQAHMNNSPLHSPHNQQQQSQLTLSSLTNLNVSHMHQQTQNQDDVQQSTVQLESMEHEADTAGLCVTTSYDAMDIENYINGDGGGNDTQDDNGELADCEEEQQHQQQQQQQQQHRHIELKSEVQFGDFNVNSSSAQSTRTSEEFIALKMVTTPMPSNMSQSVQQGHANALEKQTQQQPQNVQEEFQQPQTPTSSTCMSVHTTPNNKNIQASSASTQMQYAEDDEIGAFFKAVAMKIRSANLPPIVFTDLQIDILRVINESLKNH